MVHHFPLTQREVTVEPIPTAEQTPCWYGGRYDRRDFIHGTNTVRQTVRVIDTGYTYEPHDFCASCSAATLAMFDRQERSRARELKRLDHLSRRPADFLA